MKKLKSFEELESKYKDFQESRKSKIHLESNKFKRFWKWIWYLISFPFVWIFYNIRDWRTIIIFIICFIVISSEVWVPYLIAFICWNNEPLRISMLSVGSACWLFWLGPGTPFLVIVIFCTIGVKALFNIVKQKRINKRKKD